MLCALRANLTCLPASACPALACRRAEHERVHAGRHCQCGGAGCLLLAKLTAPAAAVWAGQLVQPCVGSQLPPHHTPGRHRAPHHSYGSSGAEQPEPPFSGGVCSDAPPPAATAFEWRSKLGALSLGLPAPAIMARRSAKCSRAQDSTSGTAAEQPRQSPAAARGGRRARRAACCRAYMPEQQLRTGAAAGTAAPTKQPRSCSGGFQCPCAGLTSVQQHSVTQLVAAKHGGSRRSGSGRRCRQQARQQRHIRASRASNSGQQ